MVSVSPTQPPCLSSNDVIMIDSLQKRIIDNGAVPPVVRHVSSSNPNNQRMALQTLQNLAIDGNVVPSLALAFTLLYLHRCWQVSHPCKWWR